MIPVYLFTLLLYNNIIFLLYQITHSFHGKVIIWIDDPNIIQIKDIDNTYDWYYFLYILLPSKSTTTILSLFELSHADIRS